MTTVATRANVFLFIGLGSPEPERKFGFARQERVDPHRHQNRQIRFAQGNRPGRVPHHDDQGVSPETGSNKKLTYHLVP